MDEFNFNTWIVLSHIIQYENKKNVYISRPIDKMMHDLVDRTEVIDKILQYVVDDRQKNNKILKDFFMPFQENVKFLKEKVVL